jgi:hypothetical protein
MKKLLICLSLVLPGLNSAWAYTLTETVIVKGESGLGAHLVGACKYSTFSAQTYSRSVQDSLVALETGSFYCQGSFNYDGDRSIVTVNQITTCRPATAIESPITNPPCSFPE